jgi:hypothetical protein
MTYLPQEFWATVPIPPQAELGQLYAAVFARTEKRSPKWKFRLATDLIVQIHPKLTTALLKFECLAVQGKDTNAATLTTTKNREGLPHVRFDLRVEAGEWKFRPRFAGPIRRGYAVEQIKTEGDIRALVDLRSRLIAVFQSKRFDHLHRQMMLGNHCLVCGKGLTDPVSMARFIGPECWGSASNSLPFVSELAEPAA